MNYLKIVYFFVFILALNSCKKNDNNQVNRNSILTDSIAETDKKTIRAIGETLSPEGKETIKDWKEYQQLDDFLDNFYSSSPNEALNLSKELSHTTKQLIDSLKIDRFKQPDVSIRLNVIHNYALRLTDMSTIPNISPSEVQDETQNILDAFSSLNKKINNLAKQEKLEKELKGFTAPILIEEDSISINNPPTQQQIK
ncbi:hypothetical protein FF125_19380 [Aureibaculum algae]|uniref:Uncharacterized protein n=1 Tax=Aureibaculum algae TaxID=2584122 RepID=A0A5B7TUG4_9FLAO|nr:hypothetical protein [Aureibaculum algae]QCX40499.1 hypothetical protein FF125_19380 [Aureibaculum algae]